MPKQLLHEMLDDILVLKALQDPSVFNTIEVIIQEKESNMESAVVNEYTYEGGCLHGNIFVMDLKLS